MRVLVQFAHRERCAGFAVAELEALRAVCGIAADSVVLDV